MTATYTERAHWHLKLANSIPGEEGRVHCFNTFVAIMLAGGLKNTDIKIKDLVEMIARNGGIEKIKLKEELFSNARVHQSAWVNAGGKWPYSPPPPRNKVSLSANDLR